MRGGPQTYRSILTNWLPALLQLSSFDRCGALWEGIQNGKACSSRLPRFTRKILFHFMTVGPCWLTGRTVKMESTPFYDCFCVCKTGVQYVQENWWLVNRKLSFVIPLTMTSFTQYIKQNLVFKSLSKHDCIHYI